MDLPASDLPLTLLVGVAVIVGLVGVLVPVLPGLVLVWAAVLVWATEAQTPVAWAVLAVTSALFVTGSIAKYFLPGRSLTQAGVPRRSTLLGGALAVVGFFVVPVIGLPVGFVLGVYLAERARLGDHHRAVTSTGHALRAAGWTLAIELLTGLLMAASWVAGVALS